MYNKKTNKKQQQKGVNKNQVKYFNFRQRDNINKKNETKN